MIHVEHHGPVIAIRMARGFLGRPIDWTTAYWVDGLLIDAGPPCTARQLLRVLNPLHIDSIVVTHAHEDHMGGLPALRARYPHVPIYASRRTVPLLREPSRLAIQLYRRLLWGRPKPVPDVISLDEVDEVLRTPSYCFRVVETPGHSRDHISLYEPTQRWIFSGDAFVGGPERHWPADSDLFAVLSSLRTLASLRPERLFPASGNVRRTPLPELHEKIGLLLQLTRAVARLDAAGMTVPEMVTALFNGESPLRWWTMGHLSAAHLIEACRSYNALMAQDDRPMASRERPRPFNTPSDSSDTSTNPSTDYGDIFRS
ncbi:MBL fold metallo-hydrolase [Litorilinea aerophila]|uniref:MBL fold metallo-hydrolase n=1 Tax=Litorilinea aerophila TaxID=1204385 RepID=A0A540VDY9_9CHLR|nr:MBL fold metallo-hydrolase [Litorilinea aerophila]MCC9077304.1 MBL fold metallo-hydrolase [Litorilinea aerophila]GIV79450.1 MAG: MBL fold hydrolase [Litorilinea sp.]